MKRKSFMVIGLLLAGILSGCNGKSATTANALEIESTTTEIESTTSENETTTVEIESTTSENETTTVAVENTTVAVDSATEGDNVEASTYTITDMDKIMYATKNCNVRKGPDADTFERIGALNQNDEVHVTGKVNEVNWYRISLADGSEAYVSAPLLSDTKQEAPATPTPTPAPSTGNGNTTQQPADDTPSSDVGGFVNPATGEPLKPGESFITPDGEEIHGPTDWSNF